MYTSINNWWKQLLGINQMDIVIPSQNASFLYPRLASYRARRKGEREFEWSNIQEFKSPGADQRNVEVSKYKPLPENVMRVKFKLKSYR